MKKCEAFKDMILTDYIDGQLDKNTAKTLESHLQGCHDCRAFLQEIKVRAVLPFAKANRQQVPAELWETIQQKIENEEQAPGLWEGFINGLKGLFVFPRLVPVFASLIIMLLVGSVGLNTIQVQQAQTKDQGEYLVSLLSPASPGDNNDPGTSIEHYFL